MEQDTPQKTPGKNTRKTVLTLSIVTVLMFGFAFAMVPLYRLICDVTGWNSIATTGGRIQSNDLASAENTDKKERIVTVQFDATINGNVNWEFKPSVRQMQVTLGKMTTTSYYVKNNSGKDVITQSIPGVTPWQANEHLKKLECFCFTTQTLTAGEEKDMGLQFMIDPNLPEDIHTLTLSYTIMDTDRTDVLNPNKSNLPSIKSNNHEHHHHDHATHSTKS